MLLPLRLILVAIEMSRIKIASAVLGSTIKSNLFYTGSGEAIIVEADLYLSSRIWRIANFTF
jgi:hypothetical protein